MTGAPIVIVAPCPLGKGAVEGWMSRISAIDRLFEGQPRVYLDFISGGASPGAPVAIEHGEALQYNLDMGYAEHRAFVEREIGESRFVYVHTVHLARFVLPYYPTGKIVTDIHGIVPEEEVMLGRPSHADFYEAVECVVAMNSRLLVVVTEAMQDHLKAKYPEMTAEFLVVPIIEKHVVDLSARRQREPGTPYRAIYAGGTQVWQNIEDTLAVAAEARELAVFEFLSHEHEAIRKMAETYDIEDACTFRVTDKVGLAKAYMQADLGFVLRDDVAVNRVSCPTKLSEYLWFGVVPIVKSPDIGDFGRLGFEYVTAEEFAFGLLPDEAGMARMRARNREVIEELAGRYERAAERLNSLVLSSRIVGGGMAGLPVGWRHLAFPSQAELYLFAEGMTHRAVAVEQAYTEMAFKFDPPVPASSCRFLPLLADLCVVIESIELRLAPKEILEGAITALTPGTCLPGVPGEAPLISLPRATPYVDLILPGRVHISEARIHVRFEAIGIDAVGRRGEAAQAVGAAIPVFILADSGTRRIDATLSTT